jgi:CRISPR-associated protein Csb2
LDGVFEYKTGVRRPTATCEPLAAYRDALGVTSSKEVARFEFMVLRITGTMHGADTAAYLGRALRRAVMSVLGDSAPGAVHGHNGGEHVGWLPLPDVGHRYAKGRIIGVGVALPKKMDLKRCQQVLAGVNRIGNLHLPDGRIAKLSPIVPGEKIPVALKDQTWIRPSTVWSTVTPVVLDRPPKQLIEKRLRCAMAQSLVFAGYPEPVEVEVSAFSKFQGAPPAFKVPAKKPRYHATVRFKEPIAGPVIAGRMRYFGVGLFRSLRSADNRSMV